MVGKKWWIISSAAMAFGLIAFVVGFKLPELDDFLKNFLASLAATMLVLAIGIWLIEGPLMTREQRLHKVVAVAARSVAQLNEEIAIQLVRDIGECLASKLGSNIDLYGEERGDWTAFKRLLRIVFQDARQVSVNGLPKGEPLSEQDYLNCIESARSFMIRVRSAIGSDREIQAQLLELLEHWNKLDARITEAGYQYITKDEKMRYATLGAIGDTLIDLVDACPRNL
jgi:hypothetical protein